MQLLNELSYKGAKIIFGDDYDFCEKNINFIKDISTEPNRKAPICLCFLMTNEKLQNYPGFIIIASKDNIIGDIEAYNYKKEMALIISGDDSGRLKQEIDNNSQYNRIYLLPEPKAKYDQEVENKILRSSSLGVYNYCASKELLNLAKKQRIKKINKFNDAVQVNSFTCKPLNNLNYVIYLNIEKLSVYTVIIESLLGINEALHKKFIFFYKFLKNIIREKFMFLQNIRNNRVRGPSTIDFISILNDQIYSIFFATKQFIIEEPYSKILDHENEVSLLEKEDQINNKVALSCNTVTIAFKIYETNISSDGYSEISQDFKLKEILLSMNDYCQNLCEICHQSYQNHVINIYHNERMVRIKMTPDKKSENFPETQINTCQYNYETDNNVTYEDILDVQYLSYSWAHFLMQFFYNMGYMTKQNSFKYLIGGDLKICRRFKMKKINVDFIDEGKLQLYDASVQPLYGFNEKPILDLMESEKIILFNTIRALNKVIRAWAEIIVTSDNCGISAQLTKTQVEMDKEQFLNTKVRSCFSVFTLRKKALLSYLKIFHSFIALSCCQVLYENQITNESMDEPTIFKKVLNAIKTGTKKDQDHSIFKCNREECTHLSECYNILYNELHNNILLQDNGIDDLVIPINSQDLCSVLCYVLSSKEYWNSLYIMGYLGLNDRSKSAKSKQDVDLSKISFLKIKKSKRNIIDIECKDSSILRMKILLKREKGNQIMIESAKDDINVKKSKNSIYYEKEGNITKESASDEVGKVIDEVYNTSSVINGMPGLAYNCIANEHKVLIRKELNQGEDEISISIYYAKQFEALRAYEFGCSNNFLQSVLRSDVWKDNSGGKTKANFFRTYDQRFVIKCIDKKELNMFKSISFSYFHHIALSLNGFPTALAKVYGAYRIVSKESNGQKQKVYAIIMENIFYDIKFTIAYDLKGSETRRYCKEKEKKVKLDTNFKQDYKGKPLLVDYKSDKKIKTALINDSKFLAESMVMDYSLLLVIDESNKRIKYGIIDYVRKYTFDKRMETAGKSFFNETRPTVINPSEYRIRFLEYLDRYILGIPELSDCKQMDEQIKRKETEELPYVREDSKDSKDSKESRASSPTKLPKGVSEIKEEIKANI